MLKVFKLQKAYQILLIMLAFLMPLTVSGANTIVVLICFTWLLSGNYKIKAKNIISSKVMIASLMFYSVHLLGMIWTEDIKWGFHILHKMWYFLLFLPILFDIVKKEYVKYYISSFLLAISFTEIVSYLVWFELIDPFKNATVENPTPFMSHITYNPVLAFAIYLVLHEVFFNKNLSKFYFFVYSFFAATMSINMFITGGRAGQVMYFVAIIILIFQFFNTQKIKALLAVAFLLPSIFFIAYQTSPLFEKRVYLALNNISEYISQDQTYTSVGIRLTFAKNSWIAFKDHPILGAGTGDFPSKYRQINEIESPSHPYATNPHNMYMLVLVQSGLIGLFSLFYFFYTQINFAVKNTSSRFYKDVGLTLPILFIVINLSDSYLLGHYTTLMYVFFSAFLYKDFEKY